MNKSTIILNQKVVKDGDNLTEIDCYDYDTIDSTNKTAWQLHDSGTKAPFVVTAITQSAGKGQRGNEWRSPEGGLYLSLILDLNLPIENSNQIILFSIWGIVNQLRKLAIPVQIKWLNDLVLEGDKLGGILCETRTQKQIIKQVVIGVGINYQNSVPINGINLQKWQTKNNHYPINSLLYFKNIIIQGLIEGYYHLINKGLNAIIKDYNLWLNSRDSLGLIDNKMLGKILGINEQGELIIQLSSTGAKTKINICSQDYRISYRLLNQEYYQIFHISNRHLQKLGSRE